MSLMKTGVTADTFQRLLYDQGLVYANYGLGSERLLGATRGGNKLEITPEIRKMPFDGVPGDVKGDKRKTGATYKLTVNLSEISTDNLLAAYPGAENNPNATHDVITCDTQIAEGDYFTNITLILEKAETSQLYYAKLSNCLAQNGISIDGKEKDEAVLTVEFTAHFDVSDLSTEPFEIGNPLEDSTVAHTLTYLAGSNGEIIGDTPQVVADGADGQAVYADPDSGYQFDQWSDASTDNPRQDTSVSADVTVTASFTTV